MSSESSGTKVVGKSLSNQQALIDSTNQKVTRAKQMINQLKERNSQYINKINLLEKELKETKSKLAKGTFVNAGEKVMEQGKEKRLQEALDQLRKRATEINNELKKYKEMANKFEKQLEIINNLIKTNTQKLENVNKNLDDMLKTTQMRFNMRSSPNVMMVRYPKRKSNRKSSRKPKRKSKRKSSRKRKNTRRRRR